MLQKVIAVQSNPANRSMKRISQSTCFIAFLVFSSGNAIAQFQIPDTVASLGLQDNAISMIRLIAKAETGFLIGSMP
jgi:hypothetical protein